MLILLEFSNAIFFNFFTLEACVLFMGYQPPSCPPGAGRRSGGREGNWARRGPTAAALCRCTSAWWWCCTCPARFSEPSFAHPRFPWVPGWSSPPSRSTDLSARQTGQPESEGSSPWGPAFSGSCWPGPHPHWGDPPKLLPSRWLEWWPLASPAAAFCVHSAWLVFFQQVGQHGHGGLGVGHIRPPPNNTVLIEGVYDIEDNNSKRGFYFALINTFRLIHEPWG